MDELERQQHKAAWRLQKHTSLAIVALATVAFYLALRLSTRFGVWLPLSGAAAVSIAAVIVCCRERFDAWLPVNGQQLLAGTLAGVVSVAATMIGYEAALHLYPELGARVAGLYERLESWPGPERGLPILLAVIVAEELVWRGVLFDALERTQDERLELRRDGARHARSSGMDQHAARAIILSAGAYALPQIAQSSVLVVVLALTMGTFWGALRVWAGNLTVPLVAHLVWDLALFVIAPVGS